jgi:cyclase
MLKRRMIGVVLVRHGIAVQSIGFRRYLPVGRPQIAIRYLSQWGIDEIVVLHIDATTEGAPSPSEAEVASYAAQCRVPLSVGGGILSADDVKRAIHAGADKVVVNAAVVQAPHVLTEAAGLFGTQCIVASIDARRQPDGTFTAYTHSGTREACVAADLLARRAEAAGAGEILITSIDRDGTRTGYDLGLVDSLVGAVGIPVIACGGAGLPAHLQQAIDHGAAAVAAANLLHFTEHSVILVKRALTSAGVPVRLDSYANYRGVNVDASGRVSRIDDAVLDALRFRFIPEEVI